MDGRATDLVELHASICQGLADPKRLSILDALRGGERSVGDLSDYLELPQPNVSQHLSVLREKGLVTARRDGQRVMYEVSTPKIFEALDLLRQVAAQNASE